jgi:hypothetical protein
MAQQPSTPAQGNEPGTPGFRRDPLGGTGEAARIRQLYNLDRDLDHRIQYYRKCGKVPFDLLDPSKPDYLGKLELIAQFRLAALRDALAERARQTRPPQRRPRNTSIATRLRPSLNGCTAH